jgi:hypothetical protein
VIERFEEISEERQFKQLGDEIIKCKKRLEDCLPQILRAKDDWETIGKNLEIISKNKLYKVKYRTFEQCCLQEFGFKRGYANYLRRTVKALENFQNGHQKDFGDQNVGQNVSSTDTLEDRKKSSVAGQSAQVGRALAVVPKEKQAEVLAKAKKSGKLTGKSIREAAAKVFKPDDVMEKDKIGRDIPEAAMAVWRRKNELKPQIVPLRELHQWAEDNKGTEDLLLRMIDFGKLVRDIEQVLFDINQAIPDVVCTQCQGQAETTCTFCKGRGMISMDKAKLTPHKMKTIINKTASQDDKFEKLSVAGG